MVDKLSSNTQTVLASVIVAILLWVGSSSLKHTESLAVLTTEVNNIKLMIDKGTSDRYTGTQAIQDAKYFTARMDTLRSRVGKLEDKQENMHVHGKLNASPDETQM